MGCSTESVWIQARSKQRTNSLPPHAVKSQGCSSSGFLRRPKLPRRHCSVLPSRTKTSPESHSRVVTMRPHAMFWGGRVYSQVSRLSLSMCDPDRTVSMSISRSELRPSGMQGINSSPSDIGSTGIDSWRVMEGASPQSPAEGAQDMECSLWLQQKSVPMEKNKQK